MSYFHIIFLLPHSKIPSHFLAFYVINIIAVLDHPVPKIYRSAEMFHPNGSMYQLQYLWESAQLHSIACLGSINKDKILAVC